MDRNLTLLTDLYQLTMMNGYLRNGKKDDVAVFDLFFRRNNIITYSVAAGLEQAIDYIRNIRFGEEDIAYLRSLGLFDGEFLDYLRTFRFTGDLYAVPEGTVVFPEEPIITVRAPILEAQFVETALLNIVNHQTLIASKSAKVAYAAKGDAVMEFGLRRAQGPDAGLYGARASVIGGCRSTSNVLAGKMFGVPVAGTHAHSWVMNFPSEYEAFRAYARLFPDACLLLVDTYDTLRSGVPNAIRVFDELRAAGHEPKGIRLDSGDLAYLSKRARKMLDDAGYPNAIICASGDLDEYLINSLQKPGREDRPVGGRHQADHQRGHARPRRRVQAVRPVSRGGGRDPQDQALRQFGQDHQPRFQGRVPHLRQKERQGGGGPDRGARRSHRREQAAHHLPPEGDVEAHHLYRLHGAAAHASRSCAAASSSPRCPRSRRSAPMPSGRRRASGTSTSGRITRTSIKSTCREKLFGIKNKLISEIRSNG